jgi:hypothetical protein
MPGFALAGANGGWSFIQVDAARHKGWNLAAPAELK